MATSAFIGSQTLLQLGNGASPEVFTTIGEVVRVDAVSAKKDLVEVTHMLSTAKEFIGGLPEGQELNFTCNYLPTNAQQVSLIASAASASASSQNFRYVLPATAGSLRTDFTAVILGSSIGPTTPDTATTVTFTVKISGSMTAFH